MYYLVAFKNVAAELLVRQRRTLRLPDVVFAGGRSLNRSVVKRGRKDASNSGGDVNPREGSTGNRNEDAEVHELPYRIARGLVGCLCLQFEHSDRDVGVAYEVVGNVAQDASRSRRDELRLVSLLLSQQRLNPARCIDR